MHLICCCCFLIFGALAFNAVSKNKSVAPLVVISTAASLFILKDLLAKEGSWVSEFLNELTQLSHLITQLVSNWSLNFFLERITNTYLIITRTFIFSAVLLAFTRYFKLLVYILVLTFSFFLQ